MLQATVLLFGGFKPFTRFGLRGVQLLDLLGMLCQFFSQLFATRGEFVELLLIAFDLVIQIFERIFSKGPALFGLIAFGRLLQAFVFDLFLLIRGRFPLDLRVADLLFVFA